MKSGPGLPCCPAHTALRVSVRGVRMRDKDPTYRDPNNLETPNDLGAL